MTAFESWRRSIERYVVLIFFLWPIKKTQQTLSSGLGSDDEVRLLNFLFEKQGYNPLIRPVADVNDTVKVLFGLAMIQLINVDEKNQIMKSNVWLRMTWRDFQLQWDPVEYGGIDAIRIASNRVWKPDIVLFNNADGKYEVSYKPNVVIDKEGNILWIPPAIYRSSCIIDVEYFPFDEQDCEMRFGSWTFNGNQLILGWYSDMAQVDLSDFVPSGTWDIISCPGNYSYTYDEVEHYHVAVITFTLKIRRKTLFYTINLIIPCVLISFLSVCVFYLPPDAGEKITMCISILLALVVFLLLVSKILPPTSKVIPLIAKYLLFTFIVNILSILVTVIVINWNFRTPRTHRMPRWVRLLFLNYLPRLLFMKRPNHDLLWSKKSYNTLWEERSNARNVEEATSQSKPLASRAAQFPLASSRPSPFSQTSTGFSPTRHRVYTAGETNFGNLGTTLTTNADLHHHPNCSQSQNHTKWAEAGPTLLGENEPGSGIRFYEGNDDAKESHDSQLSPEASRAASAIRFIAAHLKYEDDYTEVLEDWRYIALVMDRILLYLFLAVTVAGTVAILMNAPHIFEFVNQEEIKKNMKTKR